MTATHQGGTRIGSSEGSSEYFGQPRLGARVATMSPEAAGPPGYVDPFGPVLPSVSATGTRRGMPAIRTAGRRKARRSVGRQRFWGVAILVLFVLGVTAAKWFAQ
jgi:hypothetical protein